jgi:hypothetical protein
MYARPYLERGSGGVGARWRPKDGTDRELHERIIDELRHPYQAHADRTARRTLTDTSALLGLEGPPRFAEEWSRLPDAELERIADLADRQAARFTAAADEIGTQLGEKHDPPGDGWNVA